MKTILFSLALMLPAVGWAQSYSLDTYVVAGGGDTSSDNTFQVTGTIGQPDASDWLAGGDASLNGGFWSFLIDELLATGNAPLAINDTLGAVKNQSVSLPAAKLAANDTDPDGDPLTVTAVSSGSNSGTVTLVAGTVTYTPPIDFTGADSFTYTITDGHGNNATGNVNVTIASGTEVSLNRVYGPVIDNGEFVVRFAGTPGHTYTIEYIDGLGEPVHWQKLTNLTAPVTAGSFGKGVFEFRESIGGAGSRFYRTVSPAY
jgi:hypothetical protein